MSQPITTSSTTNDSIEFMHPSEMFKLGLKHPKVIDLIFSCTKSDINSIIKAENCFLEHIQNGTPFFNRPEEYKIINNKINAVRTNLEYLRDNVTKEEMKSKRFRFMNSLGSGIDIVQEQLEKFNNL